MTDHSAAEAHPAGVTVIAVVAWLWVLVPFLYGVWQLLIKVVPLFSS
jgi:pheromone shutdown protein TraB